MKKLLGIIVLCLLWCNVAFAETRTAWKIEGKYIKPECFYNDNQLHIWLSLDNYEDYFDKYISKIKNHRENAEFWKFTNNIGLYLNKEVPLDHKFRASWYSDFSKDELSLTLDLSDCFNDKPITHVEIDGYDYKYNVEETYDLNLGKKLAPNIDKKFLSIKKIKASYYRSYYISTYGILELNGKKKMVPLKHYEFR